MVETQPEVVAHHFAEAGLSEQAVDYWHKAGEQAGQRSAHVEAISHLHKGLELLSDVSHFLHTLYFIDSRTFIYKFGNV